MSSPEATFPMAARPTTLVDVIIAAARMYGAHLWTLLGASLVLQALKVGVVFGGFAVLGEPGIAGGGRVAAFMLILNGGLCARLALDVRAGKPATSPFELLRRSWPALPGLLWASSGFSLSLSLGWVLALIGPVFPVVLAWAIVIPAKMAVGGSGREAWSIVGQLAGRATGSVTLLCVFVLFPVQLMPALADSAVGRQAPIHEWWVAEGLVSMFLAPLVSLTIALLFFALVDEYGMPSARPPKARKGRGLPRTRDLPVGIDPQQVRTLRRRTMWASVPLAVGLVAPFVVLALDGSASRAAAAFPFMIGMLFLFIATVLHVAIVPSLREVVQRAEGARLVRAEVASIVAYRPRFALVALPFQMLRYTTEDGTTIEACSQIMDRKVVVGQEVDARVDPADPSWIAFDKPLAGPLRRRARTTWVLLVLWAVAMAVALVELQS